jgi:7,8-dihydropterin-6-yl-methyl-4-(beta-D-ribofuranosyl)aminobenzene 5'-phosphate synthase
MQEINSRLIGFIILLLLFSTLMPCFAEEITITVTYNNIPYNQDLTCAWGMSCFIDGIEKRILFDTGGDGRILLSNMEKLGINPEDIEVVVLSHIHSDHVGGLWDVLNSNNNVLVYLPESFPENFKQRAAQTAQEVISVDEPVRICKEAYSIGHLGDGMKEQSLVINTKKGLVVIVGCSHPGIVNITKQAKQMLKQEVYLILGGFHIMGYNDIQVGEIIRQLKELGVKRIGPSHCTGEGPIELFRQAWGKDFVNLGCGASIKIP